MSYLDGLDSRRREQLLQLATSRARPPPPPPPAAAAAADVARLRVRAQTLSEENASLRRNLQALVSQAKRSEAELQVGRVQPPWESPCCVLAAVPVALPRPPTQPPPQPHMQALRRTAAAKQQRAEERHAATAAALEEQAARQQRALLDLARAAQGLAAENAQLHGRLAALQVRWRGVRRCCAALQLHGSPS